MNPDCLPDPPQNWEIAGATACGARVWVPSRDGGPLPACKSGAAPEILYFNDTHGGIDRLLQPINRAVLPLRAAGGEWLTLSGGDDHGGGSVWDAGFLNAGRKSLALSLLEMAQVDICVPGNHDLDWGWEAYSSRCAASPSIHRVLSNRHPDVEMPPAHQPFLVLEFKEHVMAVLGALCLDQTREAHRYLIDPATVIPACVNWFHERVDSVLVLSHLGYRSRTGAYADQTLLGETPDDVLVLGAHTHDVIPSTGAWHSTRYLQCGQKGRFLGFARRTDQHWRVRVEGVSLSNEGGPVQVAAELDAVLSAAGSVTFPEESPPLEQPSRDGYREECATINAITDLIHQQSGEPSQQVAALCVRYFASRSIGGVMDFRDWIECFPYGDALCSFQIPLNQLPGLLLANARRLEMPPHYLESRGMLHFSSNLTYTVTGSGKSLQVGDIRLNGSPFADVSIPGDSLAILTQSYVAEGMGGYARVFGEAGIDWSREQIRYEPVSIRETLWKTVTSMSDEAKAELLIRDGRLVRL